MTETTTETKRRMTPDERLTAEGAAKHIADDINDGMARRIEKGIADAKLSPAQAKHARKVIAQRLRGVRAAEVGA